MPKFNLRIYGLLVSECRQVLVSDECRNGFSFTKFPGGGLEFGEGFKAALKREFLEELNLNVEVGELFYFNDFYQASAFNPTEQLVSFYYFVETVNWRSILTDQHVVPLTDEGEKHRWIPVSELDADDFTFPIDKIVANRLSEAFL